MAVRLVAVEMSRALLQVAAHAPSTDFGVELLLDKLKCKSRGSTFG